MNDKQLQSANALMLRWHSPQSPLNYESFRAWVLATLKAQLHFDGAIWAPVPDAALPGVDDHGAYLYGIEEAALLSFGRVWAPVLLPGDATPGAVTNLRLADAPWTSPAHEALQHHAQRFALHNVLMASFDDGGSAGRQFVMLTRRHSVVRFTFEEQMRFELMAPHMMQAFAMRRRAVLDKPGRSGNPSASIAAAAIVGRAGYVHDPPSRFANLLRREWAGWSGLRLPEPLLEMTERRAGSQWQFVGTHISAEFLAVDDTYVVTVRLRHRADGLTQRENVVAERYAAGGSYREVAESLQVSPATVRAHIRNVFGKLQIRNKAQLAAALR